MMIVANDDDKDDDISISTHQRSSISTKPD
jgi:hypothetical protein